MGGLGHVAVKIAAAMGAEVTVLSQTDAKREDGLRFGASSYYATSDPATFKELRGSFDLILNTVSANLDLGKYLSLLEVDGTMVTVGAPSKPDMIHAFMLIGGRRRLAGFGDRRDARDPGDARLLRRTRRRPGDRADRRPGRQRRLRPGQSSDVRYRFVIDATTIGA